MSDQLYYIASLKHTIRDHEHITFWGPNHRGYVLIVKDGHTGEYTLAEAQRLNDGFDCLAAPVDAVKALVSPEPYYANGRGIAARFYDTPGPVVDNTRANWNRLIAAGLDGRTYNPKPEVHRRKRRSFALAEESPPMTPQWVEEAMRHLEERLLDIALYGDRGNEMGVRTKIRTALRSHLERAGKGEQNTGSVQGYGDGGRSDRATCQAHGGVYPWTHDCPECVKDAQQRGMPIETYYSRVRPTLRPHGVPPAPAPKEDECTAGHAPRGKCSFGPHGWRGLIVCRYCGQAPSAGVGGPDHG